MVHPVNGFVATAAPLLSAVAWPLAALAMAALFRREVRLALDRLARLKYGAMELTFRDDLREAEALARCLPPPPGSADRPEPGATVRFEVAAPDANAAPETLGTLLVDAGAEGRAVARPARDRRSPRDAIRRAWDDLAHAVVEVAARLGDRREPDPGRPTPALRFLVDRGYLSGDEGRLVDRLRRLADRADRIDPADGHDGPAPGRAEAERFAALAGPVRDRLLGLA